MAWNHTKGGEHVTTKTKVPTHQFMWNGDTPDLYAGRYCTCERPERHPSHQVTEPSDDVKATEARILGEHEE